MRLRVRASATCPCGGRAEVSLASTWPSTVGGYRNTSRLMITEAEQGERNIHKRFSQATVASAVKQLQSQVQDLEAQLDKFKSKENQP